MSKKIGLTGLCFIAAAVIFGACAKRGPEIALMARLKEVPMSSKATTLKGLAYVTAEKNGIKWANNVSVIVKLPDMIRLDAIERISDVVATLAVKDGKGVLELPLDGEVIKIDDGYVVLPRLGKIPISTEKFAQILCGRPLVEGGAVVSEAYTTDRGSYFIKGRVDEMEMSSKEKMPLVYSKYEDGNKKRLLYEAAFDDFITSGGDGFPRHIVIRFERPKFLMEINYSGLDAGIKVHEGLFVR